MWQHSEHWRASRAQRNIASNAGNDGTILCSRDSTQSRFRRIKQALELDLILYMHIHISNSRVTYETMITRYKRPTTETKTNKQATSMDQCNRYTIDDVVSFPVRKSVSQIFARRSQTETQRGTSFFFKYMLHVHINGCRKSTRFRCLSIAMYRRVWWGSCRGCNRICSPCRCCRVTDWLPDRPPACFTDRLTDRLTIDLAQHKKTD